MSAETRSTDAASIRLTVLAETRSARRRHHLIETAGGLYDASQKFQTSPK
jgi:hypothetical protein